MAGLIPYGLRDGVAVHIREVLSGLACGCMCLNCGTELIARKGNIREDHFAHRSGIECAGQAESVLHGVAKDTSNDAIVLLLRGLGIKDVENEGLYLLASEVDADRLYDALSDIGALTDADHLGLLNDATTCVKVSGIGYCRIRCYGSRLLPRT